MIEEMGRSTFTFMGQNFSSSGGCGTGGTFGLDDSSLVVSILNAPNSGPTNVNADFYLGNIDVIAIQIGDLDGEVYVAINGSLTVEIDKVTFSVTVQEISAFLSGGTDQQAQLSGIIEC